MLIPGRRVPLRRHNDTLARLGAGHKAGRRSMTTGFAAPSGAGVGSFVTPSPHLARGGSCQNRDQLVVAVE